MMARTEQARIQEEVYSCVRRMRERFYDQAYKGHENEILPRTIETSKDMLNKYQAFEEISPAETHFFLFDYVQLIMEKIDCKKETLGGIMFKLHALVKIFGPDEKKSLGHDKELEILQRKIDRLQIQKADLEKNLVKERNAKEDLFQRLSRVAGDRIKTGNPEIADLSDPNRPMKLAEKFNNLYSNAWSDAFERLQQNLISGSSNSRLEKSFLQSSRKPDSKNKDEEITRMLFEALKSCYEWSQKAADCQKRAIIKAGMGNIDFDNNQMRSVDQNQGSHQSKTWPTQVKMQGIQAQERSFDGNQGPRPSMTSPPQGKMQRQQAQEMYGWDTQEPYPRDFQRSTGGNQGSHSSMTSPPQGKMQGKQAQETDDEASTVRHADEVKDEKEGMESSILDYPAKEFMRCAGVESAKRLPEKICQKVMEDKKYQDIEVYIKECAELCWLMRIQFPPIELLFDIKPNDKFDSKYYKPYITSGETIAFPVWPTMLLHKDGPILSLGVVQCKKQ